MTNQELKKLYNIKESIKKIDVNVFDQLVYTQLVETVFNITFPEFLEFERDHIKN